MNSVAGKRLLILGGTSASYDLVRMAKEMGIYTVVTDNNQTGVAKEIADETALVSTADIDALVELAKEKGVDGVFCGPSEFNLRNVIRVCEKGGYPCYTDMTAWDRCANKDVFKQYCRDYGVDCTPEYPIDRSTTAEELEKIPYPIIVKPVDGSSSAGITICRTAAEVPAALEKAYAASTCKKIIAEKYIENGGELFCIRYFLRDGEAYPYMSMDTYVADGVPIANFAQVPSKYTRYYMENMDSKVREMLKGMGVKNGSCFIQSLPCDGKIYFHEMGYRLSGGMSFKLTQPLMGINDMKMMLRCAVGGESVTDEELARIDLSCGGRIGAQLMMPLSVGTIGSIKGTETVEESAAVCNYLQYYHVGDTIDQKKIGTIAQQFCRITFLADREEDVRANIERFQTAIEVLDTEGCKMNNSPFCVERMR